MTLASVQEKFRLFEAQYLPLNDSGTVKKTKEGRETFCCSRLGSILCDIVEAVTKALHQPTNRTCRLSFNLRRAMEQVLLYLEQCRKPATYLLVDPTATLSSALRREMKSRRLFGFYRILKPDHPDRYTRRRFTPSKKRRLVKRLKPTSSSFSISSFSSWG